MFCSNDIINIQYLLMNQRVYLAENELVRQLSVSNKTEMARIIEEVLENNGLDCTCSVLKDKDLVDNAVALLVGQQGTRIIKKKKARLYYVDPSNGEEVRIDTFEGETSDNVMAIIIRRKKHRGRSKSLITLIRDYLTPYKNAFIQLFFSFMIVLCLQLVSPFLMQLLFDKGASVGNINVVISALIGVVVVKMSMFVAEFIKSWLFLNTGTKISLNLVSDFLEKVFKSPLDFFNMETTGNVLQRVEDNNRVESFLTKQLPQFLFSILSLIVSMTVLAYYHARLFVIFLIGAVAYILWILLFWTIRKSLDLRLFKYRTINQDVLVQSLNSAQELRLSLTTINQLHKWQDNQIEMYEQNEKMLYINKIQELGCLIINEAKDLLIIYSSIVLVMNGSVTFGAMFAIQYVLGQANSPLFSLPSNIMGLQMALISMERMDSFAPQVQEEKRLGVVNSLPDHASISFKNVSFSYSKTSTFFLKNVTFTIEAGSLTTIVGNTGSGKSTIAKLLLRCYNPVKGSIQIGGINLQDIAPDVWYDACGAILQDSLLLDDTIMNNVALGASVVDGDKVIRALQKACIYDFVESLPDGVNTRLNFRGKGLSRGQIQRLLLARMIYKSPRYIIIDEAMNSLDTETEAKIMKGLKEFFRDKTTLMITHDLRYARFSHQILVMDRGKIVEWGTHEYLMEKKNIYYRLYLLGAGRRADETQDKIDG